jgi:cysteine sulfinate desulfinase/cysteine desulfurase-like protein
VTQNLLGSGQKKRNRSVPAEVSEAFARHDSAKTRLENFRQKHHKVIEEYDRLQNEVVSAFEECRALYELNKDVLGPSYLGFSITKRRQVDADLLLALLPNAINLVKFTLPVGELDAMVSRGVIPEDIAEQIVSYTESVSGPKT